MPNRNFQLESLNFRELFSSLPEAMVVLSPDLTIVEATDGCLRFMARTHEKSIGWNLFDVFVEELDGAAHLKASLEHCLKEGKPKTITLQKRGEPDKPGVPAALCQFSSTPIIGAEGQVAAILLRMDDLSENAVSTQLQHAKATLKTLSKEYEGFAHSVSHDLRAPLRGIDMYAGIVADEHRELLDEEGRRLLELTRTLARKMNGLIDDLLAFSRLGPQRMLPSMVDMSALARSVFDELKAKMPARKVRLDLEPLPQAFADASLIKQVFGHLLSNALKFAGPREEVIIAVTGHDGDEENTYCVRDNGVGFDPQFAGKMFGMFQRMHTQEEFEGSGAGLALTQRIIQKHGGRIWAESREGEGALFSFTLPGSPAVPGRK